MIDVQTRRGARPGRRAMEGPGRLRHPAVLAAAVIALAAFIAADAAGRLPHFNPDESRWLSRAHYLADLRNPFGPTWDDQYMTRGQPPLGSYAMGLGLLLQGRDLETNPPWDFSLPWEENIAIGNKPSPDDLAAGRRTSAALVALTTLAMIAVTRIFVSLPWALAAGVIHAIHPFTVYIGSIAMSDALFGLLIALAALAGAAFARRPGWPRAALLGVMLGLGGATKLSPLVVAVGLGGGLVVLGAVMLLQTPLSPGSSPSALGEGGREMRANLAPRLARTYALCGLTVVAAAAITFVTVYPYLWPDPVGRTRNLFAFRAEEMAAQGSDWPVMAVPTRAEAVRRVGVNFTERFNVAAAAAAAIGRPAVPLALRQAEVALALAGVAVMARMAIRAGPLSPRFAVLAVLGGQVIVTILGMRSEFDRYHLPMALLGVVAVAVALDWLIRQAARLLARRGA